MNQEFHIKGLSGLALFIAIILALLLAIAMVPALALMVTWNALVFEGFHGPAIQLWQGVMLWAMLAIALKVFLKPTMEIEFRTKQAESLSLFNETRQILDEEHISAPQQTDAEQPSSANRNAGAER